MEGRKTMPEKEGDYGGGGSGTQGDPDEEKDETVEPPSPSTIQY
jgi:hypothetical protein